MVAELLGSGMVKAEDRKALAAAQDIMWTAMDTSSRAERIKLSEQALALSPDCADAYVYLAYDREETSAEKIAMFEEGIKAGRRALGTEPFKEDVGAFWGVTHTRPFMRALFGLAYELQAAGRLDEAIANYKELMRLNTYDNQGVRYHLVTLFISLNRLSEAMALVKKYPDDVGPEITYNRALLLFKKHGDSEKSREALGEAVRWNRHVIPFLVGPQFRTYPKDPNRTFVTMGGEDEAYEYAKDCRELWHKTKGAVEWVIDVLLTNYIDHKKLRISDYKG
jgi:tetratricopeptide (TPR) repeat protein